MEIFLCSFGPSLSRAVNVHHSGLDLQAECHQRVFKVSLMGHQAVIKWSSSSHQVVFKQSFRGHTIQQYQISQQ